VFFPLTKNDTFGILMRGENMKIKVKNASYPAVCAMPPAKKRKTRNPNILLTTVVRIASLPELWATRFSYRKIGMERLKKKEPCLILMNHSAFIDLKIASAVLYPRPYNIVCTSDGFVGKNLLMNHLGCIPTQKFVTDLHLVRELITAVKKRRCSVLMYPEASYSFDGTATPLPDSIGKCIKKLGVPVVMIRTYGAFAHDPLYNGLRHRKVKVSAEVEYLLSPEEAESLSAEEIQARVNAQYSFDNFRWQQENGVKIREPFRAEGLNRVLFTCPHCEAEGQMQSQGDTVSCKGCGVTYRLTEEGTLQALNADSRFTHIPDWYHWQREQVRKEIERGRYQMDLAVDICVLRGTDRLYRVGSGHLRHTADGFHLIGCDGELDYRQSPTSSYSLYADYFWYEIGDVICIGDNTMLYYCFPQGSGDVVAKARLATEELYKLQKQRITR